MKLQSARPKKQTGAALRGAIAQKTAKIGILGLGYVGLPLACLFAEKGFQVTGFDVDPAKIRQLAAGKSYIRHIGTKRVAPLVKSGAFAASDDFSRLGRMDVLIICVPTPLTRHREPDLQFIVKTGEAIARYLRPGQLVVLESSTYPGTTTELLKPILERGGLRSGRDFLLVSHGDTLQILQAGFLRMNPGQHRALPPFEPAEIRRFHLIAEPGHTS